MLDWRRVTLLASILAIVLIVGQSLPVFAAPPTVYDFRLTQGTAKPPFIKAYADIIGTGEGPAKGLQKEDLKVKIGPTTGKVTRLVPFEDTTEGIGYVLLVDVSKSLSVKQFSERQETLTTFVDAMSERDQAALVTFGSEVKLIQDFSPNRSIIKEKLAMLGPSDEETAFYGGIDNAIAVASSGSSEVPQRRVVITLSDGVNDLPAGVSKGSISARLSTDPIPLYLIGYLQGKPSAEEEIAVGVMKDFANQSGGRFYDGRGGSWRGIYFAITRSIRSAFVIEVDAAGFRSDGAVYPLELSLTAANRTLTSKLQLTVPAGGTTVAATGAAASVANQPTDREKTGGMMDGNVWLYAGIAVILAALGVWFWLRRRNVANDPHRAMNSPSAGSLVDPDHPAVPIPAVNAASVLPMAGGLATFPGVLMRLTRIHEGPPPHQIELGIFDRVVLGRDPAVSHLVFENDDEISPVHCEIFFEAGCVYIQDLSSAQGTFLNGAPLTARRRIEEQDVLRIGRTEMRITFPT